MTDAHLASVFMVDDCMGFKSFASFLSFFLGGGFAVTHKKRDQPTWIKRDYSSKKYVSLQGLLG